jgi:hypothetical protein
MTLSRLGPRMAPWSSIVISTPVLPNFRRGTTRSDDQAGASCARAPWVSLLAEAVAIAPWQPIEGSTASINFSLDSRAGGLRLPANGSRRPIWGALAISSGPEVADEASDEEGESSPRPKAIRVSTGVSRKSCLASIRIPGRRSLFFPDASAGCYSVADGVGRVFLACSTR